MKDDNQCDKSDEANFQARGKVTTCDVHNRVLFALHLKNISPKLKYTLLANIDLVGKRDLLASSHNISAPLILFHTLRFPLLFWF